MGCDALNFADTYFRTGLYPRAVAFGHWQQGCEHRDGRLAQAWLNVKSVTRVTYRAHCNAGCLLHRALRSIPPLMHLPDAIGLG